MRIGRLIKGSLLERSGQVHEGDEVLEVNGIEMHDKHIDDAARIIVSAALLCTEYECTGFRLRINLDISEVSHSYQ